MPIEMICTRCRLSIQVPSDAPEVKVLCPECLTASMIPRVEPSVRPTKMEVARPRKQAAQEESPDLPAQPPPPPASPEAPAAPRKAPARGRRSAGAMVLLGVGLGMLLLGCAGILGVLLFGGARVDERLVGVWAFQAGPSRRLAEHFEVAYPADLQGMRWDFNADGTCVLRWGGEEMAGTWKKLRATDRAVKVRITFADGTSHEVVFAFSDDDHVVVDPPLCRFRREE
jgi:hypothetical protein